MLNKRFRIKDLGKIRKYLGIEVEYYPEEKKTYLNEEQYIKSLAEKLAVTESKHFKTPMEINLKLEPTEMKNKTLKYRNLIGVLLYVANGTRPDISFSVNYLSCFQNNYDDTHYKYALRVLKYLYYSRSMQLVYTSNSNEPMDAFVDADWVAGTVDRKLTTGILIRVFGNTILWKSQKQKIVSRASTHAEFYALANCVEEVIPIKGVLNDVGETVKNPVKIYEDNTGAIGFSKNGKFCKHSKHIDVSYHFVYDLEKKGLIHVTKISIEDQIVDILTKALGQTKFFKFRTLLRFKENVLVQ